MIKQIQLRGISRTPSDRMVEDGGVSESLNMYLDSAESAPLLMPKPADLDLPSNTQAKRLFLHKTIYGTFVIVVDNNNNILWDNNILISSAGEIQDITSLGNTLVITSTRDIYYLLYRHSSKSYSFLGNSIPFPNVQIAAKYLSSTTRKINIISVATNYQPNQGLKFGEEWNSPANPYAKTMANVLNNARGSDASRAVVVRYGIRLYDDSYISSLPFLLSPESISGFYNVKAEYNFYEGYEYENTETIDVTCTQRKYNPYCKLLGFSLDDARNWKDIIQSIDIFFSTQIKSNIESVRVSNTYDDYDYASADISFSDTYDKEQILSKGEFYLVASYQLAKEDELNSLIEGVTLSVKDDTTLVNSGKLLDPLKDKIDPSYLVPKHLTTFNGRIVACSASEHLSRGSKNFLSVGVENSSTKEWVVRYIINATSGDCEVLAHGNDDAPYLVANEPFGWICYPQLNCTAAIVSTGNKYLKIAMKPHPWLNCSYAYLGQLPLEKYMSIDAGHASINKNAREYIELDVSEKLYISSIDNPFTFPVSGIHTFDNKVIGVAVSSAPLSQGQFGQFPLYVFTEDGIWAMETGADGSFVTSKPLSREVCSNPDSITSIDNAVVFVTKKGVMLLQGSEVVELSPNMNGRHYIPNDAATSLIGDQEDYSNLVDAIKDKDSFVSFMQDAKIAYDYIGKRLIFISPSNNGFQYLYKLDTQTWHKISLQLNLLSPLNSYPDCLVQGEEERYTKVYDLSTILSPDINQSTAKGIIITRPFDLGEPDVYKTIKTIKIRGDYDKGNVKYFIQGSDDGRTFYNLTSLRGKSWKMFRLFILADLEPTERISWVDIEYDTRFKNRLR